MKAKKLINFLKTVILDKGDKKSFLKILKELVHLTIVKREIPLYYGGKRLYRKDIKNYLDYLSMGEFYKIVNSKKLHLPDYKPLLRNKLIFSIYCEKFNLAKPKLLSYNLNKTFFYKSKAYTINNKNELTKYFNKVISDTNLNGIFIKDISEMGGTGCYLLTNDNIEDNINEFGDLLINGNYIHEELVKQHSEINKIYSGSINTIRIDTYLDNNNNVNILTAGMRFGGGNSFVDNLSSDGFWVRINMEDGTLNKVGRRKMKTGKGTDIYKHPDTNFEFGGLKIPFFDEACALVVKFVEHIPDRLIGWDVAISENGPIIIEGNDNASLNFTDQVYGGYLKHPMFKEIISNI